MDFKEFPKIERIGRLNMSITQKIHGSNAQVFIFQKEDGSLDLICGSRSRWIYPGDDNYGFAGFVNSHKEEFIEKLGVGQHFGEWAGPGINSGEGLTQKTFVLFDYYKFPEGRPLPPQTVVVPLLYQGMLSIGAVEEAMTDLKTNGSKLAPGFMRPEGVVVTVGTTRYKKVFDAEETAWKKGDGKKEKLNEIRQTIDASQYLQPIRLEKLLSKDSRYVEGYPETLGDICKAYFEDLVAEGQVVGNEDEIKVIRKAVGGELFKFIKTSIQSNEIGVST